MCEMDDHIETDCIFIIIYYYTQILIGMIQSIKGDQVTQVCVE